MRLLNSSGVTLLVVGAVLLFLIRPVLGWLPFIGGMLSGMALLFGLFAVVGGGFLLFRRVSRAGSS